MALKTNRKRVREKGMEKQRERTKKTEEREGDRHRRNCRKSCRRIGCAQCTSWNERGEKGREIVREREKEAAVFTSVLTVLLNIVQYVIVTNLHL